MYGVTNTFQNTDTVKIGSRLITHEYDQHGRRLSTRYPLGNIERSQYDDRNRQIKAVGFYTDTTVFAYDDAALELRVVDAKGQAYEMNYNALGWLTSRIDPNGRSDSYGYDLNGNLARWQNRRGQTTTFTYDVLNNLTGRNAAGTITSYATNPFDLFTAASTPSSTDTTWFNVHGMDSLSVSVRSGYSYRILKTYDVRGRQTTQQVTNPPAAGSVTYVHDNTYDRLFSMTTPPGAVTFTYDNVGQLVTTAYPTTTAMNISQTFTSIGARASVSPSGPPASLQRQYEQDLHGRSKNIWNSSQTELRSVFYGPDRFSHHSDDEATGASCQWNFETGFVGCTSTITNWLRSSSVTWDKVGNPTQTTVASPGSSTSAPTSVSTGNRLDGMWDYTMTYDYDGNMTSRSNSSQTLLMYWDPVGQLDSVRIGSQLSVYRYDGWGRRVSKTVGLALTNVVWDGDQIAMESNVSHSVQARYGLVGSRPIYLRRGTDTRYYVQENPGSVSGMFNVARQVTHSYKYQPFGDRIGGSTETFHNPLRFAGQYFDAETGLYHMRARYYDPRLYRFISEDPIGLAGGINTYVYAGNDPVNFRDPWGLCIDVYTGQRRDVSGIDDDDPCPIALDPLLVDARPSRGGRPPLPFGTAFTLSPYRPFPRGHDYEGGGQRSGGAPASTSLASVPGGAPFMLVTGPLRNCPVRAIGVVEFRDRWTPISYSLDRRGPIKSKSFGGSIFYDVGFYGGSVTMPAGLNRDVFGTVWCKVGIGLFY